MRSSSSLIDFVSVPFAKPRICLMGLSGIKWIMPSFSMIITCSPGFSDNFSRTDCGMTTWNFGDSFTFDILDIHWLNSAIAYLILSNDY